MACRSDLTANTVHQWEKNQTSVVFFELIMGQIKEDTFSKERVPKL